MGHANARAVGGYSVSITEVGDETTDQINALCCRAARSGSEALIESINPQERIPAHKQRRLGQAPEHIPAIEADLIMLPAQHIGHARRINSLASDYTGAVSVKIEPLLVFRRLVELTIPTDVWVVCVSKYCASNSAGGTCPAVPASALD